MEYYNGIACVNYEELTSEPDPVIRYNTLKSNIGRKNISVLHRGGGEGSYALIVYSSLPEKYRARYVAKYGDPETILKRQRMEEKVKTDEEAREFFEGYTYEMNGKETTLNPKLVKEYTLNASVLNALISGMEEQGRLTRALNNCRRNLWKEALVTSENLREVCGHTLPANEARLKEKITRYRKESYAALISGKVGNKCTVKITKEAGEYLIALKRCRVPVRTDSQIFAEYNRVAPERGWKPLKSIRSLTGWFKRPEVEPLWWDAVHGELSAHQRYGRKHKTLLPQRRDSLWYGDGTKLNLYYRDEKGDMRTIQVYEVIDAYSEVFLGYHISETENYEAQYLAFQMAVRNSMHKPYEIVHDNQGGHKKLEGKRKRGEKSFLDLICHIHRPTAPNNPQSKTIESVFGRFQREVLGQYWEFTGMNITAKKATSRPNLEFTIENRDQLPTLSELKERYAEAREQWNRMPHPATGIPRMEMYKNSVNEETEEINMRFIVDTFWFMTEKPVTFTSSGIILTIGKKKMTYEVYSSPGHPDHEWRKVNTYRKFYIKYDPYDLQSVCLYWKDNAGQLRFERVAEPYMPIHRAIQDQTEGEAAFIRQEQAANLQDRIDRRTAAMEIEYAHGVAPEQHGLNTPRMKGVPAELQRQLDRRTKKYKRNPNISVASVRKDISNLTWDQLADNTVDFGRLAEKF